MCISRRIFTIFSVTYLIWVFESFLKVWVLRFLYIMNTIYQIFYNSLAIELTFFWLLESRIEVGVLIWMMSSLPWLGLFKFYSWIFLLFWSSWNFMIFYICGKKETKHRLHLSPKSLFFLRCDCPIVSTFVKQTNKQKTFFTFSWFSWLHLCRSVPQLLFFNASLVLQMLYCLYYDILY